MKVSPMIWGAVINALMLYTDTHGRTDVEVLTSEKVVDVLHNIDEHINNILETGKISRSKRSEVKKVLQYLSSNIDRTVSFVNNPPDWLKKFFVQDLLHRVGVVEVEPDIRELGRDKIIELVKVLPVEVVIKNENKEVVDGYYLIYPDDEELKNISNISFNELRETLRGIYSRSLVIDRENKSIRLFGDTIFFSPDGFLTAISSLGLIDLKLIEEVVSNITSELSKYGKVTIDSELAHKSKIKVELTSLAEEIGKKHGVAFKYLTMIIEFDNRTKNGEVRFSGQYRIGDDSFGFFLEEDELKRAYIAKCKVESCTVPEIKLKFNNLDELAENIRTYIDLARDAVDFIIRTTKLYYESAQKHGFIVSHAITDSVRTEKNGKHAYSGVEFSPYHFNVTVHGLDVKYEISVRSKPHIIKHLKQALPSILNDNEETKPPSFYDDRIEIIGNVKLGKDLNFDSVFERVNTLLSTIDDIIGRATAVQSEKDSMKLPKEAYMALYLASKISTRHIDVKTVTGKPEVSIYSVVQSIGRKHGIEVNPTVLRDKFNALVVLIDPLIKNKYITIDEHLKLYINGKSFTELLTTYFPAITRNEAIEIENTVIEEILRFYDSQRYNEGKLLTQKLLELGILNENVIRKIITSITTLLEPENFSIEVNGKPLWHQISEETKQIYINGAYSPILLNIFKNPSLKELFSDKINEIENKILKDEIPSAITELVVLDKKYSHLLDPDVELIGLKYNGQEVSPEEVLKKNSPCTPFLRPKYAKHILVQIMHIGKDKHDFIVISTRTKDGFLIRARNVREAIEIFEREYDRLHYVLKKVNEASIMKRNIEVITTVASNDYVYRYIRKQTLNKTEIIPVNDNVLDIIKSIRKNENEEVVSA